MIYVDKYQFPFRNMKMSHLTADTRDELHLFAALLGLKKDWFQDGRHPHYDVSESKRLEAIAAGATEVDSFELAEKSKNCN